MVTPDPPAGELTPADAVTHAFQMAALIDGMPNPMPPDTAATITIGPQLWPHLDVIAAVLTGLGWRVLGTHPDHPYQIGVTRP